MKKIMVCMLASLLLLAGCGSSEKENIDKNTGKKQLIVAMDCGSAPYSYLADNQNDHTVAFGESLYASGYDVLVARDLAKALNRELVIKKMSYDKFADALAAKDVDMFMGGLLKDNTNEDLSYSTAYQDTTLTMIVQKDGKFADKEELSQFKNAKVQGLANTYYDTAIDQIKGVKHQKAQKSYADMIKALNEKKIDAFTVNQQTAEAIVKQHSNLKIVTFKEKKGFKNGTGIVIATEKDSELLKDINKNLKKLKDEKKKEYMELAISSTPAFLK